MTFENIKIGETFNYKGHIYTKTSESFAERDNHTHHFRDEDEVDDGSNHTRKTLDISENTPFLLPEKSEGIKLTNYQPQKVGYTIECHICDTPFTTEVFGYTQSNLPTICPTCKEKLKTLIGK